MRILAIRGGNLASLAAPFAVDLSADPLGTTGIFAITGETGAGKSTILDALCLALYGRYPRVAGGRREDAPDPSGDTLGSNDGRAILRRGAASGFAEVDFVGQDGVPYRVRWEAFRARGRADGRLQHDRRMLHRLDDGSAVESGKNAVAAAIEQRTDLTFDQFRRTVLLAQGEFDAFLLAAESERAELLEKITGTAIYSEISKRVHAGTEAVRAAVRTLEVRRDAIGLLDPELREGALAERGGIAADLARLSGDQQDLHRALERADRMAAARGQLAEVQRRLEAAEAELAANTAEATRLAELDAVEALRPLAEAADAAERAGADASAALAMAGTDLSQAEAAAFEAAELLTAARRVEAETEAALAAFGPLWAEAAGLDRDIAHAAALAAEAAEAQQDSEALLRSAEDGLTLLDGAVAEEAAALAAIVERLAAEAGAAFLAGRRDDIASLFEERASLRQDLSEAKAALALASAERQAAEDHAAEASRRILEAEAERQRDRARRLSSEAELAALQAEGTRERDLALADLLDRTRAASSLAVGYAASADTLASTEQDAARGRAAAAAALVRQREARAAHAAAEAARREITTLADLADGSVSEGAIHLRSLLVPGEPCPVCGAGHHPHVGSDDRLTRLAAAMAERRAALDAALRQSSAAMRAAAVEHATEEARVAQAESMGAAMGRHMAEAAAAYAALRPAIEAAGDAAGVEVALPPVLDAAAASSLAGLGEAVLALRSGLEVTLARAAELRTEAASAAEAVETAGEVIDAGRAALDGHRARAHAAALRGENLAGRATELTDRITALEREIAPCLAASALTTADLDLDPSAVVRTIEDLVAVHRTLCDRRRDHDVRLGDLARQRAVAAERHAAAERALTQAKAARDLRAGAWDALRHRRAGLLDGEATEAHRDNVTEIHRTASEARVRAEQAMGEAATRVAALQALRGAAQAAAARTATNLAGASAALAAACAPRPVETVRQWLALSPEVRTGLRATVEARSRAVEAAKAERATRRSDLAALRGEPAIDRSTTEAAIATAAEAIALGQRRLGAIDADLARDAAGRREALDLEAQIAERRRELATWEAVDEAIGSASGDKFRRFAQGVTLEHLIGLANDQLRTLSPRYRLARSPASDLALHVLDRDMGDELRATRSLSGGERFLVSLALALALSGLEGRQAFVDTLFIDEGFGSLDAETLDLAVDALETLQGRGRKVGVITHVAAMIERIAVQVRVEKRGNGRSVVRVVGGSG